MEKRKKQTRYSQASHYQAPEMFLFTDAKFKQKLNTQNSNRKQLKNMLFQWKWAEGGLYLSDQGTATNGFEGIWGDLFPAASQ